MLPVQLKNIVLVFLGEGHHDPASNGLIANYLDFFSKAQIPQIYCHEYPHTATLEEKFKCFQESIEVTEMILDKNAEIKNSAVYLTDARRPFYPAADAIAALKKYWPSPDLDYKFAADVMFKYQSMIEGQKLNRKLIQHKIPYMAIDIAGNDRSNCHSTLHTQQWDEIMFWEVKRIKEMVIRIFEVMAEFQGGVIWVHSGAAHTQNLAASTLDYIQKNNLTETHSFKILPIICASPYVSKESLLYAMATKKVVFQRANPDRAAEMEAFYKENGCFILDDIKENQDLSFHSEKMDELMQLAQAKLCPTTLNRPCVLQ